jgi:Flp pilus assembly protein TadG
LHQPRSESGIAAVEFALLAPIMMLILGVMLDLGFNLITRFNVTQSLSVASNYAIIQGESVSSSGGASLAQSLLSLVPAEMDATITVNNGPVASRTSGSVTTSGSASNANICYCPSLNGGTVSWGGSVSCGNTCPSGGLAGKYVALTAKQMYTPMFPVLSFVKSGWISTSALVQVQ